MMKNITKRTMKGQLSELPNAVIALVLITIIAAIGLLVLNGFLGQAGNTCIGTNVLNTQTGLCGQGGASAAANTNILAPYNAITNGITGVGTITSFLSLIALVIVAAIIIGLVVYAFARGGGGSERF